MKASVVIPTKNAGQIFPKVLKAVSEQIAPWPYEILVVDSGSTDGTLAVCRHFPQVRVHTIPPQEFNHGRTRNIGISLTSGEFAVMLTHDAMPTSSDWLAELVASVEAAPEIAGAFGRHLPYDDASPFTKRDLAWFFDSFREEGPLFKIEDRTRYDADTGYRQRLHFFSDNNSCLRRSVWEQIPYPEVDFAEDQLWAKQILEAGYTKAYADKAAVYHSHTFTAWETLQRSFDESSAFLRLFGYCLCPTFPEMVGRGFYGATRDLRYMLQKSEEPGDLFWLLRCPFDNVLRSLGHYLGQYATRMPERWVNLLSRDRGIKNKEFRVQNSGFSG